MMKTIYFKILIFILPLLPLLSYGQPGDIFNKPPPKGNWIIIDQMVFFDDENCMDSLWVKTIEYNDSIVWRKSNPSDLYGMLPLFFSIKKEDTVNIYLETSRGRITLSLVNNGILNDSVSSAFFIESFPHIPGQYIFPLSRKKPTNRIFPYRSLDITPKSWLNCLVNPPCKPAIDNPQSGNLIIAYNYKFNTPLKKGQYISLNPEDTTSQKPYVIIPDILDSIVSKESSCTWIPYKVKIYTDKGIYKIKINLPELERGFCYYIVQKRLNSCYFTVLPSFKNGQSGFEYWNTVIISNQYEYKSREFQNPYYDFKGTCCKRLCY